MIDSLPQDEFENERRYALDEIDTLGVLSSTQPVVEQGENVWIDEEKVALLSDLWEHQGFAEESSWDERYHFNDGTERTLNWILALDAMNFCFWAEKDTPRWTIVYEGEQLNGYMAAAAALKHAVAENVPLWDAVYLSELNSEQLAHIFRGEQTAIAIPLIEQRLQNAREVGRVLLERFDGQCARVIEQAAGSATRLVLLIAQHFPSFNDIAVYRRQQVRFYKRAQLCVADLRGAFHGAQWGAFHDFERLTAFADYKLPQVLRHYGVLEYTPELAQRVDAQQLLEPGSEEEVEIRAATIWACELLRRELLARGYSVTAAAIDQHLWLLGQHSTTMRPYHRTRTIFY